MIKSIQQNNLSLLKFQIQTQQPPLITCHPIIRLINVRVFAKAGNSLIVQPGTNARMKNILLKIAFAA
jgi:hypothetical protein